MIIFSKIFDYCTDPKEAARDFEDVSDVADDIWSDNSSREVYWRETRKTVSRFCEDVEDNWSNFF